MTSILGTTRGEGESKSNISWTLGGSGSGSTLGLDSSTYYLYPGAKASWSKEGHDLRLVPYYSKMADLKFKVLSTTIVPLG